MFFLSNVCTNPDILKLIYFGKKILNILCIIIPIILIVMLIIDISQIIMTNSEKDVLKNKKTILNRIIYTVLLFFVPTIVSVVMTLLNDVGFMSDYTSCYENANKEFISTRTIEIANEKLNTAKANPTTKSIQEAKNAIDKITDKHKKEMLKSQVNLLKPNSSQDFNNDNQIGNAPNNTSTSFENYGSGTEGKYFSPFQGIKPSFSKASDTSGCDNSSIYHDANGVTEGTKLYAGMDGTAKFYQKYCSSNNQLYSYGNVVEITNSGNTYIIYAHLKSFPKNVLDSSSNNTYITQSCPKKGNSAPCPHESCNGDIKENVIATLQVKKGDLIGYLGNTGNSTGTHLHVEIHENGSKSCVKDPWKAFGLR